MTNNKYIFSLLILTLLLLVLSILLFCISRTNDSVEETESNNVNEQTEIVEISDVVTEDIQEPEQEPVEDTVEMVMYFDDKDVTALAKVLYNECRGIPSDIEKACVGWTACNRVDAGYGNTVYEVLTAPRQFAYWTDTPVTEELYSLALDVLTRWNNERNGIEDVGRVLPLDYLWFRGDGKHNYFRDSFSDNYNIWDYSLSNPYNN